MKLAEALQERADLNYKISDLELRLTQNSLVQEGGEAPNENPEELLKTLDQCVTRLQKLIADINLTNCKTIVEGRSITEIIAEKDSAALRLSAYRTLASSAGSINFRARGSEIKLIPTVNVKDIQKEADNIAKQVRLLDNLLQSANWTTELIES
ncbi:DIP1984 family protein [Veillonella rogosae]|uniref:DIP1984 family protein n=1 Tax=Veillonella rogosae TaxID=423477 RepID=UPI0006D06D0D|nr:DIP1984 family protein [Veillonella rogosae]